MRNRAMPECCAKKCKMVNANETSCVDLTGERQQQLHATHVVSPIAACKYCVSAVLNLDLFRPIIRPSGCLSGASLLVGRACLASGCLACAAARILSSGGCQRQSHALVSWACACQQCAFSTADCLLWMGKAQKPETMSAEVRRICLQSPSTECAASEACNAHHHATLQHSLPLRPRQQAPRHADLRQWQCRVSVQPLTATSDDNVSNLRCWRNAGTHKQSTGPLATLERRYSLKHAWTAKCLAMQTSRLHSGAVPRQLGPFASCKWMLLRPDCAS